MLLTNEYKRMQLATTRVFCELHNASEGPITPDATTDFQQVALKARVLHSYPLANPSKP